MPEFVASDDDVSAVVLESVKPGSVVLDDDVSTLDGSIDGDYETHR